MLNISQVILVRTDSNLCRKELTVHWIAPNSLSRSYLQPCTNSMWGDESEAVAPIIWLYQTVDAWKEEVFFPDLLITLRRHVWGSWGMGCLSIFKETDFEIMKLNCTRDMATSLIARPMGPTMGPTWGRQDPGGPHVGHMNFAIWDNNPENNFSPSSAGLMYI